MSHSLTCLGKFSREKIHPKGERDEAEENHLATEPGLRRQAVSSRNFASVIQIIPGSGRGMPVLVLWGKNGEKKKKNVQKNRVPTELGVL